MTAKTELSAPKRRTRAEVQQLVAEFVSSGMRRSEFCQSRGLSFSTLDRHLKKLQPGIFIRELDAIANTEIDVDVGGVGYRLITVEKRHVAKIDFPIEMAGGARVIGVVGRAALRKGAGSSKKQKRTKIKFRNIP